VLRGKYNLTIKENCHIVAERKRSWTKLIIFYSTRTMLDYYMQKPPDVVGTEILCRQFSMFCS